MAFKFVAFAGLVAAASAGLLPPHPAAHYAAHSSQSYSAPLAYAQPAAKAYYAEPLHHEPEPFDHNPQYSYSYDVHDHLTGDAKSQQETRNGDAVQGSYSLIEADGSRRVVHYTADDHNGFNAVVEKQPAQTAPVHYQAAAAYAHPVAHASVSYQRAAGPAAHASHSEPSYASQEYEAHSYHHWRSQVGMGQGCGDLEHRGGVGGMSRCGVRGVSRRSVGRVGDGSDGFDDDGGDGLEGDLGGLFLDDGVEAVVVVGGVVDDAAAAVGLDEAVAALDRVTVPGLLLALGVPGEGVVHVVRVTVLGMGVEIVRVLVVMSLGDDRLGYGTVHSTSFFRYQQLVVVLAVVAVANAGFVPAPISYAAPAAPLAYSAPAAAAPLAYAAAPLAKLAPAPLAYAAAPVAKLAPALDADYDPNPQYSYAYDVQDSLTGDNKQQQETRNGDSVQGQYSFIEADGSRRIVDYTADPVNGFNAVVRKEPAQLAVKTVAAAPLAYAAPAHLKVLH
ncbi:uncharacterized protein [Venturia canescens]|uniref:uncharacterized protein n=1 Tax=Venturia canescens TaxID=32260 RepID=UPI001C9D6384|nr:uncharacterized protein LOC122415247 [Venturia canescens]